MTHDNQAVIYQLPASGIARVLHQIRLHPGITRTRLQKDLQLSQPTVTRYVHALASNGWVRDAAPVEQAPRTGRPSTGLQISADHLVIWGIHIGLRSTELVVATAAEEILAHTTVDLHVGQTPATEALDALAFHMRAPGRPFAAPVNIGVATSAHINPAGVVNNQDFGCEHVPLARLLAQRFEQAISFSTGVTAMAGHELAMTDLADPIPAGDSTLYFYIREMVGHAWIFNGAVQQRFSSRPVQLLRSDDARGAGQHALSTRYTLQRARDMGLEVRSLSQLQQHSDPRAREILDERARRIVEALSVAIDIVDPATCVFAGEAFSDDPQGLKQIVQALKRQDEHNDLPAPRKLRLAGGNVLVAAALQVGLQALWQKPEKFLTKPGEWSAWNLCLMSTPATGFPSCGFISGSLRCRRSAFSPPQSRCTASSW
ncbi:ROK family transcriptional regulator [Corynebacterium yudongzhengii]|uniref:ROK family transcriptional regulator n=1 Tax=Corynebacterium yudongzhengii TaxID=2080740 RepID=UPI0011B1FA47|nr:ROK family transcriptional regulator [Corynebacterium yudongzhengii]